MGIPFESEDRQPAQRNMGVNQDGSPIRIKRQRRNTGDSQSTPTGDTRAAAAAADTDSPGDDTGDTFTIGTERVSKPRIPRVKTVKTKKDFLVKPLMQNSLLFAMRRQNPAWQISEEEAHAISEAYSDAINKTNIPVRELGPIGAWGTACFTTFMVLWPRYTADPFAREPMERILHRSQAWRANRGTYATNPTGYPVQPEMPEPTPIFSNGQSNRVPFADTVAYPSNVNPYNEGDHSQWPQTEQ